MGIFMDFPMSLGSMLYSRSLSLGTSQDSSKCPWNPGISLERVWQYWMSLVREE